MAFPSPLRINPKVLYVQCTVTIIVLFCAYCITVDASSATPLSP